MPASAGDSPNATSTPPAFAALALAAAVGLTGCFPVPADVPSAPRALAAERLEGDWQVAGTNFPMWLDGTRRAPRFRYSQLSETPRGVELDDEVSFLDVASGGRETIVGVDLQDPDQAAHFTWRGSGALIFFTSEWYVAHLSADHAWAIIYFTATLATPEGVDVITREGAPLESVVPAATALLCEDAFLREKSHGFVWLRGQAKQPLRCRRDARP